MSGPYVHHIDPIVATVGGVHIWWYGLGYAIGFIEMLLYLLRTRHSLGLGRREVYALALFVSIGVLAGGRAVEVSFDEWPFYRQHPALIPALWLGGMATHGLLLGAAAGLLLFSFVYRQPLLETADALVIAGAFLMGVGRLGNFIDGQIVGSVTDVPWAVKFPDVDGFRHPVVLYDGLKNLALIPYLAWVRRTNRTPGATAARFVFWYAFLRIGLDLLRDYPTHRLALGTGQTLNIVMAVVGAALLWRSRAPAWPPGAASDEGGIQRHRPSAVGRTGCRLCGGGSLFHHDCEQLDSGRAGEILCPPPGSGSLLAVPRHRNRAAPPTLEAAADEERVRCGGGRVSATGASRLDPHGGSQLLDTPASRCERPSNAANLLASAGCPL